MAAAHGDGKGEELFECCVRPGDIHEFVVQHSTDGAGSFDVEVVGYPPRPITRDQCEQASAAGGSHDDLGGGRGVEHDSVHEPRVVRFR